MSLWFDAKYAAGGPRLVDRQAEVGVILGPYVAGSLGTWSFPHYTAWSYSGSIDVGPDKAIVIVSGITSNWNPASNVSFKAELRRTLMSGVVEVTDTAESLLEVADWCSGTYSSGPGWERVDAGYPYSGALIGTATGVYESYTDVWSDMSSFRSSAHAASLSDLPVCDATVVAGVMTSVTVSSRGTVPGNQWETCAVGALLHSGYWTTPASLTPVWRIKSVRIGGVSAAWTKVGFTAGSTVYTLGGGWSVTVSIDSGGASAATVSSGSGTGYNGTSAGSHIGSGCHCAAWWTVDLELASVTVVSGGSGLGRTELYWSNAGQTPSLTSSARLATVDLDLGSYSRSSVAYAMIRGPMAQPMRIRWLQQDIPGTPAAPVGLRSLSGMSAGRFDLVPFAARLRQVSGATTTTTPSAYARIAGDAIAEVLWGGAAPLAAGHTLQLTLPAPRSGGTQAAAIVRHRIAAVEIVTGGVGYTTTPTVVFSGGGGSGAVARVRVTGGVIDLIVVDSSGSGYTTLPTVSLSGGGGSGAQLRLVMAVDSIEVVTPGAGYRPRISGVVTADLLVDDTTGSATRGEVLGMTSVTVTGSLTLGSLPLVLAGTITPTGLLGSPLIARYDGDTAHEQLIEAEAPPDWPEGASIYRPVVIGTISRGSAGLSTVSGLHLAPM